MADIVLGVTGGIAAYKAVSLLRELTESGHDVTVVPTASALRFVGEPTWAALSGKPVARELWESPHEVPHVELGQRADLVIVAPATADFLARASHGIASDLLTNVLLTTRGRVVIAPAMHTEMWLHPATQANVRLLRERGAVVLDPADGRLTGSDSGAGRLPEPRAIAEAARTTLAMANSGRVTRSDLHGRHVVISIGGTQEPWDDVRFLGNKSSGRQGFALARTAIARGATVTAVVGHVDGDLRSGVPAGCAVRRVGTAEELRSVVHDLVARENPDVVVMAAAVADFRPVTSHPGKITKESLAEGAAPELILERTTDVLAELAAKRGSSPTPIVVGFAAETPAEGESLTTRALAKLARKGCDYLVANDVSDGAVFGDEETTVAIIDAEGDCDLREAVSKEIAAQAIWDAVRFDR